MNFSCSDWSRWTNYLAIVTSLEAMKMSLKIVLQKEVSERDWKCFVSYSFHHQFNGWFLINGDYFFKLNKSSKDSTWKLRQNCLKVRKVFCILGQFWLCACKSCESVKKVSRSWAMSSIKFTCIIKLPVHNLKRLFKISWIFP